MKISQRTIITISPEKSKRLKRYRDIQNRLMYQISIFNSSIFDTTGIIREEIYRSESTIDPKLYNDEGTVINFPSSINIDKTGNTFMEIVICNPSLSIYKKFIYQFRIEEDIKEDLEMKLDDAYINID